MEPIAPYFSIYEEAKARIVLEIKLPQALKRGRKKVEKIIKDNTSSNFPLMPTGGKEDDLEEEEGEEENVYEEELEEEEPPKKKGKVIITKLAKSSSTVFTRRT